MKERKNKEEIKWIQVLRGIAALLVVLLHATGNVNINLRTEFLGNVFSFGGSGVDVFFVISGFIITYTSKKNLGNPNYISTFIKKRFVRIYPTYWIIISAFLLVQILLPAYYNAGYQTGGVNLLNTYLLVPGHAMINGVSWTLTNELFFYLLFVAAFFVRNRDTLIKGLIVVTVLTIIGGILTNGGNLSNPWLALFVFPMNIEFFLGVFAGLWLSSNPIIRSKIWILVGVLGFLTGAILTLNDIVPFENSFSRVLYFGIPSFILLVGIVDAELKGQLSKPPSFLLKLGDASYSLYLLHLPLMAAISKILAKFSIHSSFLIHLVVIGTIFFICIVSYIFYLWIEKPIINAIKKKKLELNPNVQ